MLLGAVGTFAAAFFILTQVGLPQRAAFTGQFIAGEIPTAPEINAIAPDFERTTLDGRTIQLHNLQGAPVIINFWATWCVPCAVEMPILQSFYDQYRGQGIKLLAVNLGEPPAIVHSWQQAMGFTYAILLDEQQVVAAAYRLRGQPSTFVISPNGIIKNIFYGPVSQSVLEAAIAPYIN